MRIAVKIETYGFNTADAAILSQILDASRRKASYDSYFLGRPYVDAGDFKSAIPYLDDAVLFAGLESNTEWVEYLDAYCYYMTSNWSVARDKFQAFLSDFPSTSYKGLVNQYLTEIGTKIP